MAKLAPPAVTQLIKCGCKASCCTSHCSCRKHDLKCSALCRCGENKGECENISVDEAESDSDTNDETDEEGMSDDESQLYIRVGRISTKFDFSTFHNSHTGINVHKM